MINFRLTGTVTAALMLLAVGCAEKSPDRDHIPVLRQRLYELQMGVQQKNRPAIDSLLSVAILKQNQSSDSLLKFVYNYNNRYFAFERFGDYTIAYTDDKARIDCFIMDSTSAESRPVILTFVLEHDLWLLKGFETGELPSDSL